MDRFRWRISNCTTGEGFLSRFRLTLVALRQSFFDQFNLTIVASRSTFNQWNIGGETHSVDVVASLTVIKGVQYNVEAFVEADAVVGAVEYK